MPRSRRGRGEGSIYKRADGTWCASISAGYDSDGKRRRKIVYGVTKQEVRDKLKDEHQRGYVKPGRLTVGQFLDHWLTNSVEPSLSPGTHTRYKGIVENHLKPFVGWMRLTMLEPVHVEKLYADMAKAGASLRSQELAGVTLGKALKAAVKLKLRTTNPARDVDKPRPEKRELHVWDKSQVDAFLKAAKPDRLYALYVLAIATGMRAGELLGLEWGDVDFENAAVTVQRTLEDIAGHPRVKEPKTRKSRRRIDLPPFAVKALHEHRKAMLAEGYAAAPVFCDSQGGYLRKQNVTRRSFHPAIEKAGVPRIRFHDLRHTAATLLLLAGENPKVVSERLGHATVAITLDVYSHVLPTMQKEAANRLQKLFG